MSRHFITHNLPAGLSTAAYSTIKNEMTPPSQKEQLYWEGKRMEEQLLVKSRLPLNPAARNKSLEFEKYSEPTATGAERETVKEKKEELGILDTDGSEDNGDGASSHDNSSCPKPASITTTTNSLFEIRSTPNKGYSIFAKSSITKGTLILAEKPLLRITKAHYLAEHVAQAVEKLSEEDKKKYWGLASAHGQDGSKYPTRIHPEVPIYEKQRIREQHEACTGTEPCALSIFMTNAMESGTGAAVFETAARFNHSCVPNAFFGWNKEKSEERIFAIFDIQIGEEITLSYCDPFHDHSQRRWELQHYGFTCFCPACTNLDDPDSFGFKSRERRWRLSELDDAMAYPGDFAEKLKAKIETAKLMREEGLSGTCLGDTYLSLARLTANNTPPDFSFALIAATQALDVYTTCLGADSEKAVEAGKSVRAFEREVKGMRK